MKTKVLVCTLFLAFLTQSCKTTADAIIFPFSEKATCEEVDELLIGVPLNMSICKDDLFIGDSHEPMIIHYNLKEKKTNRFLSKGRGPGETQPPVILYANPFGDNRLYRNSKIAFDMGFYPLDSLSLFVPLFKLKFGYSNILPFEKDRFLSAGIFRDEYRYRIINAEGTLMGSFGDHPDFLDGENLIPFDARGMFHQVTFANSYTNRKLVAASNHVLDIIDYSLDITKESIKRILLAPYDYEYESGRNIWAQKKRGSVRGVTSAACDEKYIYLLFNSGIVGEEYKGIEKEIWVFDWNGQPVKKLILNADVKIITVDPFSDSRTAYGLAYEMKGSEEHYKIVKIKL